MANWLHSLAPPSVIDDPENGYTHRNIAFAGGLGEFWNWLPIEGISETVNDRNRRLTVFWDVLRDPELFAEFKRRAEATPLCQELWERLQEPNGPVEEALLFFTVYRQSRQGLGKDYTTPTTRTRRGMNEQVSA